MLKSRPDMPTHLIWAIEHHKQLVEDAQRHREGLLARKLCQARPLRWQGMRMYVGELLINMGQWLKGRATNTSTNTVWG